MKTPWKSAAIATWLLILAISVGGWVVFSSPKLLLSVVNHSPRLPDWARSCVLLKLFETTRNTADDDLKLFVCEHNFLMALFHVNEIERRLNEMTPASPSRKLLVLRARCRIVAKDNKKAHALLLDAKAIPLGNQELMVATGISDVEIDAMIQRIEN